MCVCRRVRIECYLGLEVLGAGVFAVVGWLSDWQTNHHASGKMDVRR